MDQCCIPMRGRLLGALMTLAGVIAFALVSAPALNAQSASGQSTWAAEDYERYRYEQFVGLPEVNQQIDFENIDYPLLHAAVLYLTNVEREKRGLTALAYDPLLETAAQDHSVDMRDRGFFSHTSPVRGKRTVSDRYRAVGLPQTATGENIAISFGIAYQAGRSVYSPAQNGGYFSYEYQGEPILPHTYLSAADAVVTQWMNSPGHRANILRSHFRHLGVGAAHYKDRSFHGMDKFTFTQNFAGELP